MKIDMSEKEAMERFYQSWLGDPEEGLRFFRTVMGFLGVTFKPEEPDLPARIRPTGNNWLVSDDGAPNPEGRRTAIVREAAARYNAVGRFLDKPGGDWHNYARQELLGLLGEERERLQ